MYTIVVAQYLSSGYIIMPVASRWKLIFELSACAFSWQGQLTGQLTSQYIVYILAGQLALPGECTC